MRSILKLAILSLCFGLWASAATAQPPKDRPGDAGRPAGNQAALDAFVNRLMAFDKNKDGKLSKDEITDERLLRLFDQADANKDGVVTKEELTALATKLVAQQPPGGGGRGGPGGPGAGPGGPGGRGQGGAGGAGGPGAGGQGGRGGPGGGGPGGRGPGGFGGPPQPGQLIPAFLQETLQLTAEQKKQLEDLQKEVDAKLGRILNDQQKKQLSEMRDRGPGGPGGPGGRGPGPGGPPSQ